MLYTIIYYILFLYTIYYYYIYIYILYTIYYILYYIYILYIIYCIIYIYIYISLYILNLLWSSGFRFVGSGFAASGGCREGFGFRGLRV